MIEKITTMNPLTPSAPGSDEQPPSVRIELQEIKESEETQKRMTELYAKAFSQIVSTAETPQKARKKRKRRRSKEAVQEDLSYYFSRITNAPVLTREQEQILAKDMISKRKAWKASVEQGSTGAESEKLHSDWIAVRDRFILANTRFAAFVAMKFRDRGIPPLELISLGSIGLIKAVDKFKPEKGFKFSTYAKSWIKQVILLAMKHSKIIRLPISELENLERIQTFISQYEEDNSRQQPSIKSIALALGLEPDLVTGILGALHEVISIDSTQINEDDTLAAYIPDTKTPDPSAGTLTNELREVIAKALRSLPENERTVIIKRFGLGLEELPQTPHNPELRFRVNVESYDKIVTQLTIANILQINNKYAQQIIHTIQSSAIKRLLNLHPLRNDLASLGGQEREQVQSEIFDNPLWNLAWAEIGLDTKLANCLEESGVYTVGEYSKLSKKRRLDIPGMGGKTVATVDSAIQEFIKKLSGDTL